MAFCKEQIYVYILNILYDPREKKPVTEGEQLVSSTDTYCEISRGCLIFLYLYHISTRVIKKQMFSEAKLKGAISLHQGQKLIGETRCIWESKHIVALLYVLKVKRICKKVISALF